MKKLMVLVLVLGLQLECLSQLSPYQWRFGFSSGITNYYGDLSPYSLSSFSEYSEFFKLYDYNKNYIPEYSYSLHLEKSLSPTVGLFLNGGRHFISMSDRFVDNDGVLQLDAPNFDRALNFKTEILDMGLGLVFKTDNGKFLKKNSFIAPYFNVGLGWLNYKVFGDLYDDNGNPYDYSSLDNINNGVFETRLDKLYTELPEGYRDHAFYGQLGFGFRIRLTRQLELFAQSDFRYTDTDYLDDVGGEYRPLYDTPQQNYAAKPGNNIIDSENPYRGNENGRNDWYINHSIGIKLSFAPIKTSFKASRVSPGNYQVTARKSEIAEQKAIADSLTSIGNNSPTNNYITFIQLNQPYNRDSSMYFLKILESDLNILKWEKSLGENENLLTLLNSQMDSLVETRERWSKIPPEEIVSDEERALQQNIGRVALQIEEATINGNTIRKELETSRQNKELYETAYDQSIANPRQADSLQFFNEIQELPAAVSQALSNRGPWYSNFPYNAVKGDLAPEQFPSARSNQAVIPYNSMDSMDNSKTVQDQLSGLRADLMQERARSNYLLRELGNYSGTQIYQSNAQSPQEIEEDRDGDRDDLRQPYYYADPDLRNSNSSRRQGYVFPLVIPNTKNENSVSSDQYSPPQGTYQNREGKYPLTNRGFNLQERNGANALSVREMARLNQLSQLGIPFDFSLNTDRVSPAVGVSANAERRTRTDTVYVESQPSDILFNNKVEIYFDINQSQPSKKELVKLNTLFKSLQNNPNWSLYITGFADNTGNLKYNLNLIDRRMEQIQDFFVKEKGISQDRIRVSSGGLIIRGAGKKSSPIDRKVEIWIQENE